MALFKIQIFKTHPETPRPFSNTYVVDASDMTEARGAVPFIRDMELDMFDNATFLTYARVSTLAPDFHNFSTVPINTAASSSPSGTGLPLFNTLRIDITTTGFGSPTRMRYRNLTEGVIVGTEVDSTFRAAKEALVNTLITDLSTNGTPWVQPDGDPLAVATAYNKVAERQLHRRRRKAASGGGGGGS